MAADILQRPSWTGVPIKYGDVFTLRKRKGETDHLAVCDLWSSQLGSELRLLVNGDFQRSQVCRSGQEWIDTFEGWKAALIAADWRNEAHASGAEILGP
jgi:hypothetical protein